MLAFKIRGYVIKTESVPLIGLSFSNGSVGEFVQPIRAKLCFAPGRTACSNQFSLAYHLIKTTFECYTIVISICDFI